MTPTEWLMQLSLVALCVFVLSSLLLSLLYPFYKRLLSSASWHLTPNLILYYCFLSLFSALSSSLIISIPHFSSRLVLEHCHQGNCDAHVSSIQAYGAYGVALASVLLGLSIVIACLLCNSLISARRKIKVLRLFAGRKALASKKIEYHIVESRDSFAWCVGLFKPQIYVSSTMLSNTSSQQQTILLAHEQCHKQDKHNLLKLLLFCLSIFWLPKSKALIVKDFSDWLEYYAKQYALAYADKRPIKKQSNSYDILHAAILSFSLVAFAFCFSTFSHFLIEFSYLP